MGPADDQRARSPRLEPGRAVKVMRLHSPDQLPEEASLLRQWKRWESGEVMPGDFYQPVIAATFGTVTHAMFPSPPSATPTLTCWP